MPIQKDSAKPKIQKESQNMELEGINSNLKKSQKFKRDDYQKITKITHIGFPQKLTASQHCKKKYQVEMKFLDQDGKEKSKLVRFGRLGKEDFIDHGDEDKRRRTISRLTQTDNCLHGNFYSLYLLNNKSDIYESYKNLTETVYKLYQ